MINKIKKANDILVIPDAHAEPDADNDRFELAGKFALEHRPNKIVCLGDWADMPSLSSYDKGHKSFEGRRYSKDIAAARDALNRFEGPIEAYNKRQRKNRKPQYKPRKIMLLGNHEHRINRAIELSPELDGALAMTDLGYEEFGWEVYPFLKMIEVDGLWFNHYFISGIMGAAISGVNPARTIIGKHMVSTVSGHSHLLDYAVQANPSGKRIHGLVSGCFFEQSMGYAKSTEHLWSRGLSFLHNVVDGEYDLEWFSMERLWELYG